MMILRQLGTPDPDDNEVRFQRHFSARMRGTAVLPIPCRRGILDLLMYDYLGGRFAWPAEMPFKSDRALHLLY
jgi:hypothetical protein